MNICRRIGLAAVAFGGLVFPSLVLAQSDVTQPGDPVTGSSTNSPGSETGPNAIDNQPTKYLNFDTTGTTPTPSGLVVSPSVGVTLLSGLTIQSANDAVERDPKWIRLEGSNSAAPTWTTGDWEVIYENNAVQPWSARFQTQTFQFDNDKPFAHYRFTVLEVQGATANSTQYAEIELLGEVLPGDVTQPGDALTSSSTNSPGSETGSNAIDGQPTKYLNFDTTGAAPVPSGFVVTPGIGSTVL
ncbi:MAG TPA: hypothetical protein VMN36_09465, partial [Verrucomicrobiales bacterium]|nr:hypothetical protein [Verrucomicrobiales bacterium]